MAAGSGHPTLRSLVGTLRKGEQSVFCVPDDSWGERFTALAVHWPASSLLSPGVFATPGPADTLSRARKAVALLPARNLLVLDIPFDGNTPRERLLLKFHETLSPILEKRGIRSLWIIRRQSISEGGLGVLKDRPCLFVDFSPAGAHLYSQCLTARGAYSPGLFFPRRVDLADPDIGLDPPALPGLIEPSQDPFRDVFRFSPEAMVLFNMKEHVAEPNARASDLLGYDREGLGSVTLKALSSPSSYRQALRALALLGRKRKASGELELIRKSGRSFSAAYSASPLGGSRVVVVLRDASADRKERDGFREEVSRFSMLAESSPIPHVLFSGKRLVHANDAFRRTFSLVDSSSGDVTLRDFLGKENSSLLRELSAAETPLPGTADFLQAEIALKTPEGERREFSISALRTKWEGTSAWYLTLTDVTARNQALVSLRESERTFREMCETTAGPVAVTGDGTILFANAACARLFGLSSSADLTGKEMASLVGPRDRKAVAAALSEPLKANSEPLRFSLKRADGSSTAIESHVTDIRFSGTPALLLYFVDTSEKRHAEEVLRKQARAQTVLEHLAHEVHLSLDPSEVVSRALCDAMKWLGFESGGAYRAEPDGGTLTLRLNESLNAHIAATLASQNANEGVTGMVWKTAEPLLLDVSDYPAHIPYKSLFESEGIRSVLYLPLIAGESVNGILLLCSPQEAGDAAADRELCSAICRHAGDALGNALRYEKIRTSEMAYRNAVESLSDTVYECAPNGAFIYVSPRVQNLTGYLPEEILRAPDLWRMLLHPDERSEYSRRISNQAEGTQEFVLEYRILPKGKAAYRWVRDAVRYRRDGTGTVTGMHGVLADITSRVESTNATAVGESYRDDILQSVQEGLVVYDRELSCREWNKGMELITGFTREDVIGKSALDAGPRFLLPDFPDLLNQALAGAPVSSEDVGYVRPGSNESSVLWCRFSPLRDRGGNIGGIVGTVTDVTHRKSLERDLRESEETLRNVIDTMGDALMISDLQGKVWEVNREFTALTGRPRSEVIGMTFPYRWLVEEEMSRLVVWLAALREKRFLRDFDMTWKRIDGSGVPISLNTTLLRNAVGEPVAMLNIARDISERKGLANDLFAKSRQIEMLNRIISTANSSTEFTRVFEVIASEVRTLTAFDHMSVSLLEEGGKNLVVHATVGSEDRFPPVGSSVPLQETVSRLSIAEGRGLVIGDITSHPSLGSDLLSARAGMRAEVNIPILLNERILGTFCIASGKADAFGLEELTVLQPIADQIGALIDRTMLFQRVSLDSAYIRDLLNSIDSVVYTVDRGSIVREVNKAWRDFALLQGTPELRDESAVIGKPLDQIVPRSPLQSELLSASRKLFEGSLREFFHEFAIGSGETERAFKIAVTPLEMHGRVNGLVFTYTDITDTKRTEAEIKRRNEELLALNAIASSVNRSLNPDEVLGVAAGQIRSLVKSDIVLCYLPDESLENLRLAAHLGIGEQHAEAIGFLPSSGSAPGVVMHDRKPFIFNTGFSFDPRVSEEGKKVFRDLGAKSLLGIPLESKDRVLGSLFVAFAVEHTFTEQEQRFIALVGNQLSSALANAQLYSEVQAQVHRVTLLYEIGKGLTGALDTRSVLTVVYDGLEKALQFDSFAYFSRSVTTGMLEQQFHRERVTAGQPPLSPDLPAFVAAMSGNAFSGNSADGGALLAVPVRSKGECIGLLALARQSPGMFADAHLRLVESIANLTEIAIDRAGLYEDTVAKSLEIEDRNKELDDFTYVVSHDLKEPLITIEGYSKIVLNDYRDVIDDEGKGYLNSIVQSGKRMKGLIDDLLTLSRLGRVLETEESLSLADVVQEVLRDFEFTLRESHATVNVPPNLPTLRYNRIQLGMVFRNLIANAIKFNRSAEPRVDIEVTPGEGLYTVSVRDNGVGIERQHYEKIFVIFQRLQRNEDFRGTGAGLTIVKKIVENHGGRIWVDSVVGAGTTFYFTIPA